MVACFLWCPGSVPLPQFILDLFSSSSLLFLFSGSSSVLLPRASLQYKTLSSKGQLQEHLAVGLFEAAQTFWGCPLSCLCRCGGQTPPGPTCSYYRGRALLSRECLLAALGFFSFFIPNGLYFGLWGETWFILFWCKCCPWTFAI